MSSGWFISSIPTVCKRSHKMTQLSHGSRITLEWSRKSSKYIRKEVIATKQSSCHSTAAILRIVVVVGLTKKL